MTSSVFPVSQFEGIAEMVNDDRLIKDVFDGSQVPPSLPHYPAHPLPTPTVFDMQLLIHSVAFVKLLVMLGVPSIQAGQQATVPSN